jgi:hypothetical protein
MVAVAGPAKHWLSRPSKRACGEGNPEVYLRANSEVSSAAVCIPEVIRQGAPCRLRQAIGSSLGMALCFAKRDAT